MPVLRWFCASAGGAGVRAGALPSRPAHGADAAPRLRSALRPRCLQPHHPRPQTALPALSPGRRERRAQLQQSLGAGCSAAPQPRSDHIPQTGVHKALSAAGPDAGGHWPGWADGCRPHADHCIYSPGATRVGFALCLFGEPGQSRFRPRALHHRDSLFANLRNKGCVSVPLAPVGGAGTSPRAVGGHRQPGGAEPRQSLVAVGKASSAPGVGDSVS